MPLLSAVFFEAQLAGDRIITERHLQAAARKLPADGERARIEEALQSSLDALVAENAELEGKLKDSEKRATGDVGSSPSSKILEGDCGASTFVEMGWIRSSTSASSFARDSLMLRCFGPF